MVGILCLWICLLLHLPLYNAGGGQGVRLPWNTVAWAVAVTVILSTAVMAPVGRPVITPASCLLFLSALLLTLPVFWTPVREWVNYSLPRLSGLWGSAVFYLALLQCRFSHPIKRLFLWCVTFASLIQGGNVMAGIFYPALLSPISQMFLQTGGRESLGIFQQVNVTASFLATGFALSLALIYRAGKHYRAQEKGFHSQTLRRIKLAYLLILIAFLPCVLVLTRSRTGWLGGIAVYIVTVSILLTGSRQKFRSHFLPGGYRAALVLIPLAGVAAGLFLLGCSVTEAIDHGGSNYQRWLTLKVTWEMISLHPWSGWGLGSFIMQFQHFIASRYSPNPSHGFMGHPHNEILYVWMEGGIVALAGLVVLGFTVVMLLLKNRSPGRRLIALALLPILLHTLVEYPLYLSSPHVLVLLLITLSLDRTSCRGVVMAEKIPFLHKAGMQLCLRGALTLICIWLLASLYETYQLNTLLSRFEVDGAYPSQLPDSADIPWLVRTRYDADRMNLLLERYNSNGDLRLLRSVVSENAHWLKTHTNPDNYVGQMEVLRYLHRTEEACRYLHEGHKLFPMDERLAEQTCQ